VSKIRALVVQTISVDVIDGHFPKISVTLREDEHGLAISQSVFYESNHLQLPGFLGVTHHHSMH
jgi:hypothetical protein